jgi:hypothetical protein
MEHLKRGRHQRLNKKLSAFEQEFSRAQWPAVAIMVSPIMVFLVVLSLLRLPHPLVLVLLFGIPLGSIAVASRWYNLRCRSIARNRGLICSRCSHPLVRTNLWNRHGAPFTIPSVCPHCNLRIEEAARPAKPVEE